jgi:hypothetical protein
MGIDKGEEMQDKHIETIFNKIIAEIFPILRKRWRDIEDF